MPAPQRPPGRRPRPGVPATPSYPVTGLPALPTWLERELDRTAAPARLVVAKVAAQKALAARAEGRTGAAIAEARKAKEGAPRSSAIREIIGRLAYERGAHQEALAELQTFRRLSGEHRADALLAALYRALGRPERAMELAAAVDRKKAGEEAWGGAQIVRAALHADQGSLDAAAGVLRSADGGTARAGDRMVRAALAALLRDGTLGDGTLGAPATGGPAQSGAGPN